MLAEVSSVLTELCPEANFKGHFCDSWTPVLSPCQATIEVGHRPETSHISRTALTMPSPQLSPLGLRDGTHLQADTVISLKRLGTLLCTSTATGFQR